MLLKKNPPILKTAAVLIAFFAAKDQILGCSEVTIGPDGKPMVVRKPGVIEIIVESVGGLLGRPLIIISAIPGVVLSIGAQAYF